jgi:hypothetical protein
VQRSIFRRSLPPKASHGLTDAVWGEHCRAIEQILRIYAEFHRAVIEEGEPQQRVSGVE